MQHLSMNPNFISGGIACWTEAERVSHNFLVKLHSKIVLKVLEDVSRSIIEATVEKKWANGRRDLYFPPLWCFFVGIISTAAPTHFDGAIKLSRGVDFSSMSFLLPLQKPLDAQSEGTSDEDAEPAEAAAKVRSCLEAKQTTSVFHYPVVNVCVSHNDGDAAIGYSFVWGWPCC